MDYLNKVIGRYRNIRSMKALEKVGTPYTKEDYDKAAEELKDKSELDAVVAYLQGLGLALKNKR